MRRFVFAGVFALVCTFAGCTRSTAERALSFREIMRADVDPGQRGQQVTNTAVVTYSDPEWHQLFLQDSESGAYLTPPANSTLKTGDTVLVRGITTEPDKLLANTQFTLLKSGPAPVPVQLKHATDLLNYPSTLVQLKGIVRRSGIRNGRATLELSDGDQQFKAVIFPGSSEDLPPIGSEMRIAGVSACAYDSAGHPQSLQLFVPSFHEVELLKAGPADPFSLANTKVSALRNSPPGTLVHLFGKVVDHSANLFLEDSQDQIPLNFDRPLHGDVAKAEIVGFWSGHSIDDTLLRPLDKSSVKTADVRQIGQLKLMNAADAASRHSISVQATVTYWDPEWHILFVQDNTGGAFVVTNGMNLILRTGDILDISGVTGEGDYAPVILEPSINFVRRGPLPNPFHLDIDEDNLSLEDSRWCSARGIVHSATVNGGHTLLTLSLGQTPLLVQFPTIIKTDELIDKEISFSGVLAILFNERRQAVGHQIFIPSPEFMKVEASRSSNPPTSIASLRRYSPSFDEHHAVNLSGTVVLISSGHTIFMQDQTAGIEVRTIDPVHVSMGDRVSVRGFILTGEYSPVLRDAVIESHEPGDMPQPEMISAKSAAEGSHDSQYVAVRGTVSSLHSAPNGTVLVINVAGNYFEASGPAGAYPLSLRPGSYVQVRGVCQVLLNRTTVPFTVRGFTIAFDSPRSVTVLKPGPWWDSTRVSWALLGIGIFALLIATWATVLRRQVHAKTRELQRSLEAKRKTREFDQARNQVLEGIAGNSPLPESMERLALAIEAQVPSCVCALVMPPDGKSFLNGKPSPVLVAPGLSEDSQHELLGPLSVLLDGSAGFDEVNQSEDHDPAAPLLDPLRAANLEFVKTCTTIVFSASGSVAGLIILLLKDAAFNPEEPGPQAILQSSARLLALARDHWRMHEQLVHEARHDVLTGLPNRMVAEDRLEQALARADRARKTFAVFVIDLDGFKAVNDEFGHDSGDELLRIASARLRSRIRHADTLARMGGDEFLAIIEDCAGDSAAQSVAQSLIAVLQESVPLSGRSVNISGSIGVAMYPRDGKNASVLKRCADQAMYQAKGRGGSQVAFFSGSSQVSARSAQTSSAGRF